MRRVNDRAWHETTVGRDFPHRAAVALLTYELRRPAPVAVTVLFAVGIGLIASSGEPVGGLVAVWLLAAAVLALSIYVRARRQTARVIRTGSVIRVAMTERSLLVQDPTGGAEIPFDTVKAVLVRRDFVVLRRRRLRAVGLPLAALPEGGLDRLRSNVGHASSSEPSVPRPAADGVTRTFTPDRSYARRVAWIVIQKGFLAPRRLLVLVAVAVVGALVFNALLDTGSAVSFVVALVAMIGFVYLMTWRACRAQQPPGSTLTLTIGTSTLAVVWATASVEVPYASFERIESRGAVVLLHVLGTGQFWTLPADALTADDLQTLRERVG